MRRPAFYALATSAGNGVRATARAFDPANGPRAAKPWRRYGCGLYLEPA